MSDVGLPDLARTLCRRHWDAYQDTWPLDGRTARRALEPLVNLARLHIRDGHGDRAHGLLRTLHRGIAEGTDIVIDGILVPGGRLTAAPDDHWALRHWLWTVVLADGTRALAAAGRWEQAAAHAEASRGVGRRLLDGRQAVVLAHCTGGRLTAARAVIDESEPAELWERAVAACLTVVCDRSAGKTADQSVATMIRCYEDLPAAASLGAFQARLGLTVIDLAESITTPASRRIPARLTRQALTTSDAHVARELLAHQACSTAMTIAERSELSEAVRAAGLGLGLIPPTLRVDLMAAVETAETAIGRALTRARVTTVG
ncbi:hypothetical protein [Frankia canadensis]|uniref:hypothetical protein n=1 Tax=Frankia canadensis TaxID=1836972 RepID=UPI00105553D1|nr:hypothetical protein [Frankia canadensis]